MSYSVNTLGFSGVFPPGGMPGGTPFGGVPNAFPQSLPPLAFGVPGQPAGMDFSVPLIPGGPGPIDPFTGAPLGGNPFGMAPPPSVIPLGAAPLPGPGPNPFMGPPPGVVPFGPPPQFGPVPLGLPMAPPPVQQQAQENPIQGLLQGLIKALVVTKFMGGKDAVDDESLGGSEDSEDTDTEEDVAPVTDAATALTTLVSESDDIADADGDSSSVSTADLAAVSRNKDGDYSGDAVAAAQFLLANKEIWDKVDKLDGKEDTKATTETLSKALSDKDILDTQVDSDSTDGTDTSSETTVGDNVTALDILSDQFKEIAKEDGDESSISLIDISRAVREGSGDAKAVATYLQANPDFFKQIGGDDSKVTLDEINKALANPSVATTTPAAEQVAPEDLTLAETLKTLKDNKNILDTASSGGTADQSISKADLQAVADNKDGKFKPELVAAAKAALNNSDLLKALSSRDTTAGHDANNTNDFVFKFSDLEELEGKAAADPAYKPDVKPQINNAQSAFNVLNQNLDKLRENSEDKLISFDDLLRAANRNDASPELKQAVEWLKNNKAAWDKADALDNNDDDTVQTDVIEKTALTGEIADRYGFNYNGKNADQANVNKAIDTLSANGDAGFKKIDNIQGGNVDGVISSDDMWAAVQDTSGKFTAEEKQAIITLWGGTDDNGEDSAYDSANGRDSKADYNEIKGQKK